ncbi:MAG TPA: transcriptional repressor, partial [Acidimicrobiales bacterium]|nr:transcriptional repressor [Acidimicrobiales bacterium]
SPPGGPRPTPGVDPVEAVLGDLRSRGLRVTTARRILLETLFDASGHKTADELAAVIQSRAPDVHLSTIYRNLDELERLGLVVHAHLGHGPATYHLASAAHGHFVCEVCGAMVEAPDELFEELGTAARERYGFTIDPHHFAVLGRCAVCASAVKLSVTR